MTIWFTSDLHLGHANIIKYCNRPFDNVRQMDDSLMEAWNDRIGRGDTVYVLGDFAFYRDAKDVEKAANKLNGQKFLIRGNHDRWAAGRSSGLGFVKITDYHRLKVGDQSIVLFHYPIASWHGIHRGAWHLHGHCHGNLKRDLSIRRIDIGVDPMGYIPICFDEIENLMGNVTFKPVDHHEEL